MISTVVDVCTCCYGSTSEGNLILLGGTVTGLTEEGIPQPSLQGEVLFIWAKSVSGAGEM